jgi:hypothetical protein
MESKIAGQLKTNQFDTDFYESEPFAIPYFDNNKLKIVFVEAEYQPYLITADEVLENFLKLNSEDRIKDSKMVYHYYSEFLKFGYTKALNIKETKDVWNFVKPTEIIIHESQNGVFYLCVSCECEWEEEHGLQLVFKDGQTLTRASGHDGHYTD